MDFPTNGKTDFLSTERAIKHTLCPVSRKNLFSTLPWGKNCVRYRKNIFSTSRTQSGFYCPCRANKSIF